MNSILKGRAALACVWLSCSSIVVRFGERAQQRVRSLLAFAGVVSLSFVASESLAQWEHAGATEGGIKYSTLDQINVRNVSRLEVAWTYRTGHHERAAQSGGATRPQVFQVTPILVDGALIGCTARGDVFALDPATGAERWTFASDYTPTASGAIYNKCRGVSAWTDPEKPAGSLCTTSIIYGTPDMRVIALDSRDGKPCTAFGVNGQAQMQADKKLLFSDELQFSVPPVIVNGLAIFGTSMADIYRIDGPSGKVRALDMRTGALRWEFDPVPRDPRIPRHAAGRAAARARPAPPTSGRRCPSTRSAIWCSWPHRAPARLLRRLAARRKPLRELAGGAARRDRQGRVALPDHASRHLGLRSAGAADTRRAAAQGGETFPRSCS